MWKFKFEMWAARAVLDAEGAVFLDRYNQPKARPEVAIERDSRVLFARLVRELDLDFHGASDRPPALLSNRRVSWCQSNAEWKNAGHYVLLTSNQNTFALMKMATDISQMITLRMPSGALP